MSRILKLQSLAPSLGPVDGDSTSSATFCACSTASASACFIGDDVIAV